MSKCIGCGAILQNNDPLKEGYVKDLNKNLCERCFKIRHYNEYKYIDKDHINIYCNNKNRQITYVSFSYDTVVYTTNSLF